MQEMHMKQNIIEYSNDMQDVYKNIEEYNQGKKRKILSFWWYDCWYD